MVRVETHISRPKFGCRCSRGVDDELIGFGIEDGSGFKASDVGSVAHLSLGIAPVDLVVLHKVHPLVFLLIRTEVLKGFVKHGVVEAILLLRL
jgi:hypothetical protein